MKLDFSQYNKGKKKEEKNEKIEEEKNQEIIGRKKNI